MKNFKQYIKETSYDHLSEEMKEKLVIKDGMNIKFMSNPSEKLKKLAVQQNGYAIQFIESPSEYIQKLAVQQNQDAIKYIANPSEEIRKLTKQSDYLDPQNPGYITYMPDPGIPVNIPMTYPNVTQPAGGPISGIS